MYSHSDSENIKTLLVCRGQEKNALKRINENLLYMYVYIYPNVLLS